MSDLEQRIRHAVEALVPEMTGVLRDMIRFRTVNPPGEQYEEYVAWTQTLLENLGYGTHILRVPEEQLDDLAPHAQGRPRPNLVATLDGEGGPGPRIHLNGHYDVVPAASGWTRDPFSGVVEDGQIYGRGSADMKAGIVAQIYAVEALRHAGISVRGRITQSIVADEETVGNRNAGSGYIVEQGIATADNTDAVIVTEPFGLDGVGIGHKGAIWGSFTIIGKQAHGSMPHLGVNAVEIAARILARFEQHLQPKLRERVAEIDILPSEASQSTLSFDTIHGGEATNVIPDRCTVTFNRRLVPSESLDGARSEMHEIVERVRSEDPRFDFKYHESYATEPTIVSRDEPIARIAGDVIQRLGRTPRYLVSAGSHDQRFFVQQGGISNSILVGPGTNSQSHQADEHISTHDLAEGTTTLAMILERTMAQATPGHE